MAFGSVGLMSHATHSVLSVKKNTADNDKPLDNSVRALIVRKMLLHDQSNSTTLDTAMVTPASADTETSITPNRQVDQVTLSLSSQTRGGRQELQVQIQAKPTAPIKQQDPLILDLNADGIAVTGIEQGIEFDLDADGHAEKMSFATAGDAFLALDRNHNGQIDNGRELFGEQHGAEHGFAELAKFDDNQDSVIDAQDEVFSQLRLLTQDNGKLTQKSLSDAGVTSLSLSYKNTRTALNRYDQVAQLAQAQLSDGRQVDCADVLVATQKL